VVDASARRAVVASMTRHQLYVRVNPLAGVAGRR
jgi:hypothetical protein